MKAPRRSEPGIPGRGLGRVPILAGFFCSGFQGVGVGGIFGLDCWGLSWGHLGGIWGGSWDLRGFLLQEGFR